MPVGARAGEYEVRALLGRGGMGIVYAGIHPVIGKEVAIKVLGSVIAAEFVGAADDADVLLAGAAGELFTFFRALAGATDPRE